MKGALLAIAVALLVAGCGGDDEAAPTETGTTDVGATIDVRVYWLRDGKVWPTLRRVPRAGGAGDAVGELLSGPTEQETELGFETAVPEASGTTTIAGGVASVELSEQLAEEALAQVVYTLTQVPTVSSVEIQGRTLTRADFEDFTPAILVELPLAFEEVSSPLRASGTANTFEATFSFEIVDSEGDVIADDFVTATSGTGTRGTFEFSQPFVVDEDQEGTLRVFELSAKDGSRINVAEIPLRLIE